MNKKESEGRQFSRQASAALCAVLLMAAGGCVCVNVSTPSQQAVGPSTGNAGGGGSLSGGAFVPVQNAPVTGSQSTICQQPVAAKYVRFSFTANGQTLLTQTPDPTVAKFKGTVIDLTTGQTVSNTKYYLQWFVNALPQNNGCAVNGANDEVSFTIAATALPHRFTAFFKKNLTPAMPETGHQYQLQGVWLEE